MRVHITLLDIHAGILARDLCVLMLLDQLRNRKLTSIEKIEIKATLMYTFSGISMPSYSSERSVPSLALRDAIIVLMRLIISLQRVIKDLKIRLSEQPPRMPSWLHVVSDSIPKIMDKLSYWDSFSRPVADALGKRNNSNPMWDDDEEGNSILGNSNGESPVDKATQRAFFSALLKKTPDEDLIGAPFLPPGMMLEDVRKFVNKHHDVIVDLMFDRQEKAKNISLEGTWYKTARGFLPPQELLDRHPGFKKFTQMHHAKRSTKDVRTEVSEHSPEQTRKSDLQGRRSCRTSSRPGK